MPPNSDPQTRAIIASKLDELIEAIEAHELWTPPSPSKGLYFVWDFLNRSKYMLSEYDKICNGNPLQYPDQFRPAPGTGERAAKKVFDDVCGRSMMAKMIIDDSTGRLTGAALDYGNGCREKAEELVEVSF